MFLSDELENIYTENTGDMRLLNKLLKACFATLREKSYYYKHPNDILPDIQRMDNVWRQFCKKHKEFDRDAIKTLYTRNVDLTYQILHQLHWD